MATDINCLHLDFLPFHQQLIGITKFFDEIKNPNANQLNLLRQWFWRTSFSTRYSTGNTNAKMDSDIECILELRKGDITAFDDYKYGVTEQTLGSTKFSKANHITRAFLLLMGKSAPVDLVKNIKIDIGRALSQYNRKEFHHVFPHAFLESRGVPQEKIDGMLNFCFLSSESNKSISKKSPSDYFFNLVPSDVYSEVLKSNLLPVNKEIYKDDNFDFFIKKRASLLILELDLIT